MAGFAPQTERDMIETLTGIFEGGTYCTLADNPADSQGGLSYGRHQASELQGGLVILLKMYVARTAPPLPNPGYRAQFQENLSLYDAAGRKYLGPPAQRASYKQLLKTACTDPAMQRAQDDFFGQCYFQPAMKNAELFGAATPLGRAISYDIAIQAGAQRLSFYKTAITRWIAEHGGASCAACSPRDTAGPDEISFLRYVNAARRTEMMNSSSPAYRASVYRPNEFDKLIDAGNLQFKTDFVFRGYSIKALPS